MERLGVVTEARAAGPGGVQGSVASRVAALGGHPWRTLAGPAAFLLAATLAIGIVRTELRPSHARASTHSKHAKASGRATALSGAARHHAAHRLYVVRPGDTVYGISARTGIPETSLLRLNPKISPTSLFIGEKIRLR